MLNGACILCSTINTKNIIINNTYLQSVYEKLADLKIDNVSCWMCFICHRRLQQCHRLWQLVEQTRSILLGVQQVKIEAVLEPEKCLLQLSPSGLINIDIPSTVDVDEEFEITVKNEPSNDGINEEYVQENIGRCDEETATGFSSDAEDDELVTGIVLSQYPTGSEDFLRSSKVMKLEVEKLNASIISKYLSGSTVEDSTCSDRVGSVCEYDPTADKQNGTELETQSVPTSNTFINTRPSLQVDKPFSCDIYQRKFTVKRNLREHHTINTDEKPFIFDIRQHKFTVKRSLKAHLLTHSDGGPFSCGICERKFTIQSQLKSHVRIHTGEKPFSCDICERKFTLRSQLKSHVRIHTGEKPFSCDICERKFTLRSQLKSHVRIHTGEKPFSCDICERKFTAKRSLKAHLLTHRGEKPFSCDICDRKFSYKINLKTHLITHTGDKPFSCHICLRKFLHKRSLQDHIRIIHTDETPFSCNICQHKFSRKSSLLRHLKVHSGEKPFSCDTCLRKFLHKSNLKKHLNTHTEEIL